MFFKKLDAGSGHQYDHCFSCATVFSLGGGGRGGVQPSLNSTRWAVNHVFYNVHFMENVRIW